jgi:hypothetical protein
MSGKVLQLSPRASTQINRRRTAPQNFWSAPSEASTETGFLRTWFENDSDLAGGAAGATNWSAISGLALSVAVSGTLWAGIAWMVARVWR